MNIRRLGEPRKYPERIAVAEARCRELENMLTEAQDFIITMEERLSDQWEIVTKSYFRDYWEK